MINCKNCGAPLSLNDAVCPNCGTPNPEAQEHIRKLAALDNEFHRAENEVRAEVRKSRKGYGVLVILVMLLLANLVLIPFHSASYEIAEKLMVSNMSEEEIRQKLDGFLEEGNFTELFLFTDRYSLSYRDYSGYTRIASLAMYYKQFIDSITNYLYSSENYTDPLVRASRNIIDFKTDYRNYLKREEDPGFKVYAEQLNRDFDAAAKVYLKLTDEDLQEADKMTNSAMLVRVNERLNNENE